MILMVVEDRNVDHVVTLIKDGAYTGNFGDGKVFVSPVDEAYTVRTGTKGL
jgi:nitrogen regulatory protein PII 1